MINDLKYLIQRLFIYFFIGIAYQMLLTNLDQNLVYVYKKLFYERYKLYTHNDKG